MVDNRNGKRIDLHTHTNKSDGSLEPFELIKLAADSHLSAIAITDHDTLEAFSEISASKQDSDVKIIPGVELSARYTGGTLHIVGLGIDPKCSTLLEKLETLRQSRSNRNSRILEKLNELGIEIGEEEANLEPDEKSSLGRPHIAKMLMDAGVVDSIDEAFDAYLGRGKKAFVKKEVFEAEEAIKMIHDAGGVAVLAHPASLELNEKDFPPYLDRLIDFGIDGIEVYVPTHSVEQMLFFRGLASDRELLISAGSDFHGDIKPDISIGRCYQGNYVYDSMISGELLEL